MLFELAGGVGDDKLDGFFACGETRFEFGLGGFEDVETAFGGLGVFLVEGDLENAAGKGVGRRGGGEQEQGGNKTACSRDQGSDFFETKQWSGKSSAMSDTHYHGLVPGITVMP